MKTEAFVTRNRETAQRICSEKSTNSLMIQVIEKPDAAVCDELAAWLREQSDDSAACGEHDPRWLTVLQNALGHRPIVLIARNENDSSATAGAICGYLPLAMVSTRLFGRFLVSLPYLNRAGIVTSDPSVAAALIQAAVKLADEKDVQYLELRHSEPVANDSLGFSRDEKVRMVLKLPANEEALFKDIGPKVRNLVRKGDKHDLSIKWTSSKDSADSDVLDAFYNVFAINMRDLGTPVYSRRLFGTIIEQFAGEAELCAVFHENQPIAGALLVHDDHRKMTQVPSASSLREFNHTSANMWMYHHLLLRAMDRGSEHFDFGRSSEGSGTYRFKKQWGALPQPTVWQYHVRRGDIGAMRPDSPKNQRRVAMWQKLPVWLTRLVGPRIVRGIP